MSKLKAIILKGIINEKFEEIFYNKQETDISELKFVISKINKSGDGTIENNDNICYYRTFLPNENQAQSFFYIIYCHKSNLEDNIEECFEGIVEILNNINKFNSFTLNKFPNTIKKEINEFFNNRNNYVSNLKINNEEVEIIHNENNRKDNNIESNLRFSLLDVKPIIIKEDNSGIKNVKLFYLIICILLFIAIIILMRKYMLQKK